MKSVAIYYPVSTKNPSGRLAFLDSYRLLAIVMVIGIHSFAYVNLEADSAKLLAFIVRTIAVQVFFLVDGFIFARSQVGRTHFEYVRYVRKSAMRLLLPWLIFSLSYTALRYYFEEKGVIQAELVAGRSFRQIGLYVYASMIAPQLYFLVSLFLIRCATCMTRLLVSANSKALLAFLVIYTGFCWSVDLKRFFLPGQDPVLHAFWGWQYYLLGIVLYRFIDIGSTHSRAIIAIALGTALATKTALAVLPGLPSPVARLGGFFAQYGYLLGTFYLFYKRANKHGILSETGKYTMGIYLLHAPVVLNFSARITALFVHNQVAAYFTVIAICFMLSLLLTRFTLLIPHGGILFGETAAVQKS